MRELSKTVSSKSATKELASAAELSVQVTVFIPRSDTTLSLKLASKPCLQTS